MIPNAKRPQGRAIELTAAAATDAGRLRTHNEDAYLVDRENGLFIVSDGMGGEHAGALASKIVVEMLPALLRQKKQSLKNLVVPIAGRTLLAALCQLSNHLRMQTAGQPGLEGMGATVVLALIRRDRALVAHMGDSRAYLFRDGKLKRLTKDHSLIQLLIESGDIKPEEADTHPARSQLTRYVGMKSEPLPEAFKLKLERSDQLLLCTDGLTGMVSDAELRSIFKCRFSPEESCRQLIAAANAAGGKDNITALIVSLPRRL